MTEFPWCVEIRFESNKDLRDWVSLYLDGGIDQSFDLHNGEYLYASDWHRSTGANAYVRRIDIRRAESDQDEGL